MLWIGISKNSNFYFLVRIPREQIEKRNQALPGKKGQKRHWAHIPFAILKG
jgi:hypothetical protein